ncbi:MAG: hypothetical protein EOM12_19145 [Verrucomicrobiae bacterium]|nr:hypothetical protein [Verrucomicrobiae bacterium]
MKKNFWKSALITMGLALCVAPGAEAYTTGTTGTFTTYFGEDEGKGENTSSLPGTTASNAETAFLNKLSGVTTEDFEKFYGPKNRLFNNSASTTGIEENNIQTDPSTGRYAVDGITYIATGNTFSIQFAKSISAFGIYGIDITDFDSEDLKVNLYADTSTSPFQTISISSSYDTSGSALYFGLYSMTETFNKIEFINSADNDVYGFDKMSIGTPVPLPPTALMLGSSLLGLVGLFKFRKRSS